MRGRNYLHFVNCSYPGLEKDERLIEAANASAEKYGMSLANLRSFLSSSLYQELQGLLEQILLGYSMITPTTTPRHCSVRPLLVDKDNLIIIDLHVHNSVQMGVKLCAINGTTIKYLKRHNNMARLEEMVLHEDHQAYKRIWFLGDGISAYRVSLLT